MKPRRSASDPSGYSRRDSAEPVKLTGGDNYAENAPVSFARSTLRRLRKHIPPVSILLFTAIVALGIGFVIFTEKISLLHEPAKDQKADAIIVLTGGKARIETALQLLQDGRGQRLLISGVHPTTKREALQRVTHADPQLFKCCIDLDRTALNTIGNAKESAKWVKERNYNRIFVVTNNYHIPRSLLELSREMSDVELIPYPVTNTDLRNDSWIKQSDTLRVLFTEYIKYIGAILYLNKS